MTTPSHSPRKRTQRDYTLALAETIKRLERELAEEKLRNKILNGMVDIMDNEYGAGLRKKYLSGLSGKPKPKAK